MCRSLRNRSLIQEELLAVGAVDVSLVIALDKQRAPPQKNVRISSKAASESRGECLAPSLWICVTAMLIVSV